jgi:hypothetical protein
VTKVKKLTNDELGFALSTFISELSPISSDDQQTRILYIVID